MSSLTSSPETGSAERGADALPTAKGADRSPASDGDLPPRPAALVAVIAAAQAAVAGLLAIIVPAIVIWMATPRISVTWVESAQLGVNLWALAQTATLVVGQGSVSLVPLGLLLPMLWLTWAGGCRVVDSLDTVRPAPAAKPGTSRQAAGTAGPSWHRGQAALAAGVFCLTYATIAVAAAALAGSTAVRAPLGAAGVGAATVALAGLGIAAAPRLWTQPPERISRVMATATGVLRGWLGLGALALLVGLIGGAPRIIEVQQALQPGGFGHVLLVLLQLVLLPTAVVWGAGFVAGPGFSVGIGTLVSPMATELGPLPAVPLLGALPEPGSHPLLAATCLSLVVGLSAVAGYRHLSVPERSRGALLLDSLAVAALVALAAGLLAGLSSGAVGAERMSQVGPGPVWTAAALWAESFVGVLAGVMLGPAVAAGRVGHLGRRLAGRAGRASGKGLARAAEQVRHTSGQARQASAVGLSGASGRLRDSGRRAAGRASHAAAGVRRRLPFRRR